MLVVIITILSNGFWLSISKPVRPTKYKSVLLDGTLLYLLHLPDCTSKNSPDLSTAIMLQKPYYEFQTVHALKFVCH